MAAIEKTERHCHNFVAHLSARHIQGSKVAMSAETLIRQIAISANCVSGEFGDERKFASFSPEFLVLTMSLAVRTHSPVMTICRPSRRGFSKQEAFAGANSAGIRDELQS